MNALVEGSNLESDIAECCRAIHTATDPDAALETWGRLRELLAERSERERKQFLIETRDRGAGIPAISPEGS